MNNSESAQPQRRPGRPRGVLIRVAARGLIYIPRRLYEAVGEPPFFNVSFEGTRCTLAPQSEAGEDAIKVLGTQAYTPRAATDTPAVRSSVRISCSGLIREAGITEGHYPGVVNAGVITFTFAEDHV